jgi:hypothetical protein
MHHQHELFTKGIHDTLKIRLTFFSKEDNSHLIRLCAPMDYAISRQYKDGLNRYWFWDYDSDCGSHNLGLLPAQIVKMELLADIFEPNEFVTWDTKKSPWTISRNWGMFS